MSDQVISPGALPDVAAKRGRFSFKRLALTTVGLGALVGAALFAQHWYTVGRFIESTDNSYVGGNVTAIAPRVAGFVQQVLVIDNQFVKAGQPLVKLDPADYDAALKHAQAVLQSRLATIGNLQAERALQELGDRGGRGGSGLETGAGGVFVAGVGAVSRAGGDRGGIAAG